MRPTAGHATLARSYQDRANAERLRPLFYGETDDGEFTATYFDSKYHMTVRFADADLRDRACIADGLQRNSGPDHNGGADIPNPCNW